ncbi:hypothetical protein CEXT_666301, partial [Caerostris extrusa]
MAVARFAGLKRKYSTPLLSWRGLNPYLQPAEFVFKTISLST